MSQSMSRNRTGVRLPAEVLNILGTGAAILGVVATGSGIISLLPEPNAWEFAAAYLGPAGVAFAAYWWVAQKL